MTALAVVAAVTVYVIIGAGVAVCTAYSIHLHYRLEQVRTDWGEVASASIAGGLLWPVYGLVLLCIRAGRIIRRRIEEAADRSLRQREEDR